MARPAIGQAAKSEVGTVRLTPAEKAALEKRFGTVTKALRALVTAHLKGNPDA